jgi:chromosome segregation ATPase
VSLQGSNQQSIHLEVENVGGIESTTVDLDPGVTALTGRNATNRTSLLQAIMAALGSDRVSLKGDADAGHVECTLGGETYTRSFNRQNGRVVTDGDPFLVAPEDVELAELFAFLLESNEARRAVALDGDLRELIMRPVDTEAIEAEIQRLEAEKRDLDDRIEELDELETELPDLEQRRARIQDEISETEEDLGAKQTDLEEHNASVEERREEQAELEGALEDLNDARSELERVRSDIDRERQSIEALEADLDESEDRLESLPETPVGDLEEIEAELDRMRSKRQEIDRQMDQLGRVVQFNEDMLEGTSPTIRRALQDDTSAEDDPTDQLVESDTVACWTCGSQVDREAIEETLERLRDLRNDVQSRRSDLREEIEDYREEQQQFERQQRERERLERDVAETESEIETSEERIEELQKRASEIESSIEQLQDEVDEQETDTDSEVLELHKEINQLEFALGRKRQELEDVEDEIAAIEAKVDEREDLAERREEIQTELEDCRSRVEDTETGAIEQFNEHMAEVLDLLEYANIERIWLERVEREIREGRRKVSKASFELHIVRSSASGTVYEDTIDNLSESEREVTGLVFALAGYLVHDVHELVPVLLLDSLEAIDSDRIATLVEYVEDYAAFVVTALLPEDAQALPDHHHRVSSI